jgi:hypothetical protein
MSLPIVHSNAFIKVAIWIRARDVLNSWGLVHIPSVRLPPSSRCLSGACSRFRHGEMQKGLVLYSFSEGGRAKRLSGF